MEFKQHIVAFADVLGASGASKEPVTAKHFGERLLVAHKLLAANKGTGGEAIDDISMNFFSDSIILAGKLDAKDNVARLLNRMALYQALLAVNGLFLRGGIAIGEYLKTETVDFGPPLVEAAYIEKHVSKDSAKICLSSELTEYGRHFDLNVMVDRDDGTVFLDFMSCLNRGVYRDRLRDRIMESLAREEDKLVGGCADNRVLAKLYWLANYFNFHFAGFESIPCPIDGFGKHRFQRNFAR